MAAMLYSREDMGLRFAASACIALAMPCTVESERATTCHIHVSIVSSSVGSVSSRTARL